MRISIFGKSSSCGRADTRLATVPSVESSSTTTNSTRAPLVLARAILSMVGASRDFSLYAGIITLMSGCTASLFPTYAQRRDCSDCGDRRGSRGRNHGYYTEHGRGAAASTASACRRRYSRYSTLHDSALTTAALNHTTAAALNHASRSISAGCIRAGSISARSISTGCIAAWRLRAGIEYGRHHRTARSSRITNRDGSARCAWIADGSARRCAWASRWS
jgi:hypothetical protein